ncbi:hypothetical protein LINGRAHAP2_LOCUS12255 [Linum grandiflorum]
MAEATPFKPQAETEGEGKQHDKETHGTSNDIDENTSIDEVKGPGVLQRAKEEIEALVETIHPPKKEDEDEKKSS